MPGEPMSPARVITDEELLQLPKDGNKYEVVDGERVAMGPAGMRHEDIVMEIGTRLREVLSPSDRMKRVLDKVGEYLDAGVRVVWVIDPVKRKAVVYRTATEGRFVDPDGELDGEDVLPGFRCALADLFA